LPISIMNVCCCLPWATSSLTFEGVPLFSCPVFSQDRPTIGPAARSDQLRPALAEELLENDPAAHRSPGQIKDPGSSGTMAAALAVGPGRPSPPRKRPLEEHRLEDRL